MKPQINLSTNEPEFRGSNIIFGVKTLLNLINIIPYGEKYENSSFEAFKIKFS